VALSLVVGLAVSALAFAILRALDTQTALADFEPRAAVVAAAVQSKLDRQYEMLRAVDGLFDASERVEPEEFRIFARQMLRDHPSAVALAWAPSVDAAERDAFEGAMRATGAPGFVIADVGPGGRLVPAPARPSWFPLAYLARRDGGTGGLGLDIGPLLAPDAWPPRRLHEMRGTRVGAFDGLPGAGDWMLLTLTRSIEAAHRPQDWAVQRAPGFVVCIVDAAAMVESALEKTDLRGLSVEIAEFGGAHARPLFVSGTQPPPGDDGLVWIDRVDVGLGAWRVRVYGEVGAGPSSVSWHPWFALGIGLLLTGGLAGFLASSAGRTRWIEAQVRERTAALHEANSALAEDVARRREVESELRRLGAELERRVDERTRELVAAYEELETFSYSASHDLRSPLRTLSGMSELLLEDHAHRLDDEGRDYLQRIRTSAERLAEAIEAMLEMSRTVRGGLRTEVVDLGRLAREVADEVRLRHPERSVEVAIACDLRVRGDPRLLRAAFENLIGNAFKFTAGRSPAHIEVGGHRTDGQVECYVRDDGVGFDMRDAARIFEPFQRLHRGGDYEGSGIGLAIVRRIVHRHLGRIWAEGEPGRGATFRFTLPAA
jgi:signal transduction histidine kinase